MMRTCSLSCSQCRGFIPGVLRATIAGTFGRKAVTLSLMVLQMLLWATFPLLSKTREAFWIAVPSLKGGRHGGGAVGRWGGGGACSWCPRGVIRRRRIPCIT